MIYYHVTREGIKPLIDTRIKPLIAQIVTGVICRTSVPDPIDSPLLIWNGDKLVATEWNPLLLPHTPEYEGKSHINMYSKSKTFLGQFLSNFQHFPGYAKAVNAHYNHIEGLWQYMKTGDQSLCYMDAREAKNRANKLPNNYVVSPKEFYAVIRLAVFHKLVSDPTAYDKIKKLDLPVVHYYVMPGRGISYKDNCMGLEIVNLVIKHIKEINNENVLP